MTTPESHKSAPENNETQTADSPQASTPAGNPNTFGMLCHLLALCGLIGIPFGNILGPLVMWLIKRHEFPFVDACGKEALNFQISMTIYTLIAGLSVLVFIGFILLPAIIILNLAYTIVAAVKANEGKEYAYPLTIRFIK